jgi:predicted Zn-dependent protease
VQLASMFTPGYYGLAPQAVNAMMQYQQAKKLDVLREESEIKQGLSPTRDLTPDAAKLLVQNMAAKEFGHALGLKANSPIQGDLLYPELKSDTPQLPSQRDLETLRQLYNRPPNIILNVR